MADIIFDNLLTGTIVGNSVDTLRFGLNAFVSPQSGSVSITGFARVIGNVTGTDGNDSATILLSTVVPSKFLIDAGAGDDRIVVDGGVIDLTGGSGNDTLFGGRGFTPCLAAVIDGGDGNDRLFSDTSADTIRGGAGDDYIGTGLVSLLGVYDGGAGFDELAFGASADTAFDRSSAGPVDLRSIERVSGFLFNSESGARLDLSRFRGSGEIQTFLFYTDFHIRFGSEDDVIYFNGEIARSPATGFIDGGGGYDSILTPVDIASTDLILRNVEYAELVFFGDDSDTVLSLARWNSVRDGFITITLGSGNDRVTAGALPSDVFAGDGNDTLIGAAGYVSFAGGEGDDSLVGGAVGDNIAGDEGNDTLLGRGGDDFLAGGAGDDSLNGGTGNDAIDGGAGNDTLIGGAGIDTLTGDAGADRFVFAGTAEAGNGAGSRDVISDFAVGIDRIMLGGIDAQSGVAGNQAFKFIGGAAFSGVAGQLRSSVGGVTIVEGDVNGDGIADFQIELTGQLQLSKGDFVL